MFVYLLKVQSKHIACVAVSSLYIAGDILNETMNPDDLVNISQSKCTSRDLQRMSNIIKEKLNINNTIVPITTIQFFRLYRKLLEQIAEKLDIGPIYNCVINEQDMYIKLEIIACDMRCSSDLPSLVALVLIFIQLEQIIFGKHLKPSFTMKFLHLYAFAAELKKICNVRRPFGSFVRRCNLTDISFSFQFNDNDFSDCIKRVSSVLNLYNGKLKVSYRQRLIWRVSRRTMKQLRPTKKLTYKLPTIVEDSNHH